MVLCWYCDYLWYCDYNSTANKYSNISPHFPYLYPNTFWKSKTKGIWGFPGSLVKTPCFPCRGHGFHLSDSQGTKIPRALRCRQKINQSTNKTKGICERNYTYNDPDKKGLHLHRNRFSAIYCKPFQSEMNYLLLCSSSCYAKSYWDVVEKKSSVS